MEQMNFHKQKLYALIAAGVALISLLLPWIRINVLGASQSWNGFRGWGYLSFLGVVGVAVLSIMGNKAEDYSPDYKRYVQIAFGAIAAGAILFWIRKENAAGAGAGAGLFGDIVRTGFGLWLCLIAGLAGLALSFGLIKPESKTITKHEHSATGTTTISASSTTTPTDTTVQP